ncbi:MAG TPA: GAF and ANTAR domain-containing protein [Ilumatobacteraceae bacterium]|jgi:transcriptional regulator with GAF, ATPase, and Fis domain|nr:GAF and ANTAR domain-containing protein [Ilumatobacteraceae bacterium]
MSEPTPEVNTDREASILDAFVRLSDTLVADYDIIEFLQFLTQSCVELADVDEAAVMLASPSGHLQAVASSSERSRLLELFELQNEDGPCLDAYRTGVVVIASDLAHAGDRWPQFAPQALEVGFTAVHSVPLRLRGDVIGALNLLRAAEGELAAPDAKLVRALADIATVGVLHERIVTRSVATASGLQTALNSRVRIEQAKGILAERAAITIDEAFERLRQYARRNGRKLTEVAAGVVHRSIEIPLDDKLAKE